MYHTCTTIVVHVVHSFVCTTFCGTYFLCWFSPQPPSLYHNVYLNLRYMWFRLYHILQYILFMLISSNAFSCDSSGCGVIQYLKYDTVSEGSYTPGAARSCVSNSFKFSNLFQNLQYYNIKYIYMDCNKLLMVSRIKGNIPLTITFPSWFFCRSLRFSYRGTYLYAISFMLHICGWHFSINLSHSLSSTSYFSLRI